MMPKEEANGHLLLKQTCAGRCRWQAHRLSGRIESHLVVPHSGKQVLSLGLDAVLTLSVNCRPTM